MLTRLAKNSAQHRPDLDDEDDETIGHCGAQFGLDNLRGIPSDLDLCGDNHHEAPHSCDNQNQPHCQASQASRVDGGLTQGKHHKYSSNCGDTISNAPSQLVVRPWHVAGKSFYGENAVSRAMQLPLAKWQLENMKQEPWNNVATFSVRGDVKAEKAAVTKGPGMGTEIGGETNFKSNELYRKNQCFEK